MIISIYILIIIATFIYNYRNQKSAITTESIITLIWCFVGVFSTFGFYGLLVPGAQVHFYAITFILVFNVYNWASRKNINDYKIQKPNIGNKSNHIFIVIFFFALAFLIPMLIKAIDIFFETFDFNEIRKLAYYDPNNIERYYYNFIFKTLPFGILNALVIVVNYNVSRNNIKSKYLVLSLLSLLLVVFLSSSRYIFITFIFSFLIPSKFQIRKLNKIVLFMLAISALLLIVLTINRGQTIIKSFSIYYFGSFSFFEYILSNPDTFNLNELLYGQGMFGFILEPIITIFKVFGLIDIKTPSYHFNTTIQLFYNIGKNDPIYYNNNSTMLLYFLRDFGVLGVFVGSVFYSFIFSKTKKELNNKLFPSYLHIYVFLILFNGVMSFTSVVGLQPIISIIVFYFSTKKVIIKL